MTATLSPSPAATRLAASLLSDDLAALAARVRAGVVQVGQKNGNSGAGTIWREDGLIVTNRHVVREDRIDVWTDDGRHFTGIVADRHEEHDLAIVKIAATGLPALEIADSSVVRPGQIAIAVGHPVGYKAALTLGVVVASGQAATAEGAETGDWIQTDVTLMPGNSGGPLLDAQGRVIGIGTMVQGALSLAVPSTTVAAFVAGEDPAGMHGHIGVDGLVVPLHRDDFPLGYVLTEVTPGGPADRAGLIVGDVVVRVAGLPLTDPDALPTRLVRMAAGEALELGVLRGGRPRRFTVVAAERR